MKIAIFGRAFSPNLFPYVPLMVKELEEQGISIIIAEKFQEFLKQENVVEKEFPSFSSSAELDDVDYAFSIGGDGTLLETVTYIQDRDIGIMGINAGRLGFLATIPFENIIGAIRALLAKEFKYDERILVKCSSDDPLFGNLNFGLNEFAIQKRDTSSMIVVHTYIDGKFLNSYWADGVIVSTPTGSTGYSLSCGGALMMPHTSNFIISPVNPHNLNVRPMVVPDSSSISFEVEGRADKILVSLDSRSASAKTSINISVQKADFTVKLIALFDYDYFNTLRTKLHWGLDMRN